MSEDKEPVHFVTGMHRSIDGETYYSIRPQDRPLPESASGTIPSSLRALNLGGPLQETLSVPKNAMEHRQMDDAHSESVQSQSNPQKSCSQSLPPEVTAHSSQLKQNHTSSSPIDSETHPADSYSVRCTRSVAVSTEQQAELEEQDRHDFLEAFVILFIKQLSGYELATINAGAVPTPLMKMLGRVAYNEIERRRGA